MNVLFVGAGADAACGAADQQSPMRADLGVMISASPQFRRRNGIKFFGPDGFKLSDAVEAEIDAPDAVA